MKKILYLITQSELGGAQRYVFDLAKGLKNEYEIAVAFGEPHEKGGLAKMLDAAGIKYYTLPRLKRAISPLNDVRAIFEIKKLIKTLQPGVIHLNSSKISILGSLASILFKIQNSKFKINVVYTVHGWVFNEPLAGWKKKFYFYAEKLTARYKDKIICIDTLDYGIAKDELKIPEKKLALIHHGLNLSETNFLPREQARNSIGAKLRQNLTENTILIGSIGNLYATKGYEYLIGALESLKMPFQAVIIGEGPEKNKLKIQSDSVNCHPRESGDPEINSELKVNDKLIFAGRIDNAAELLPAFDIYVCSSVKEGFPYSILEAMAAGLPIIATEVGGIPDMITDQENGLLCEAKNSNQLAGKITSLASDPVLRQKIAERAKQDLVKRFSFPKMISDTKSAYELTARM